MIDDDGTLIDAGDSRVYAASGGQVLFFDMENTTAWLSSEKPVNARNYR